MFLLGLSGSFLPYILAFFFSLILLGNGKVVASETESSAVISTTIHHVSGVAKAEKSVHFYAYTAAVSNRSNLSPKLSAPLDREIPHRDFSPDAVFLLIPDRRGPPQI